MSCACARCGGSWPTVGEYLQHTCELPRQEEPEDGHVDMHDKSADPNFSAELEAFKKACGTRYRRAFAMGMMRNNPGRFADTNLNRLWRGWWMRYKAMKEVT